MEVTTTSPSETEACAARFTTEILALSRAHPRGEATVVGLSGELGSGKTTFLKGVAKALGVLENVVSPTFVIEKIYRLTDSPFDHLVHVDAYRLESAAELAALGFHEILDNPKNLVFIEWPEHIADILPPRMKRILFSVVDHDRRRISSAD